MKKSLRCRMATRSRTTLRFTPTAWAKLVFLRDAGPTEIGGFGIAAPDDLLCVEDVVLVNQVATPTTVTLDELAVAEFFQRQISAGQTPAQFSRLWIHTHPGVSPLPSEIDDETFARVCAECDWSVMAILARGGGAYAQLAWHAGSGGPRGVWRIPVVVDDTRPFPASDHAAWRAEYERLVHPSYQWSVE